MIRKCLALIAVSFLLATVSFAQPLRTFFVRENRLPGKFKPEVGLLGSYTEVPERRAGMNDGFDTYEAAPYVRFGLAENWDVYGDIPYVQMTPDQGDSQSGLGDIAVGTEVVVYQDIFGYPFIMPHADVSFDTGDADKGLGAGKTLFTVGASVGTVVMDMFHYIVDASYTFHSGSKNDNAFQTDSNEKNVATFGGAFIWDLNEQFSLIAEAKTTNVKTEEESYPLFVEGGFSYQVTENLMISILGGGAKNTDADVIINGKVAYSF